MDQVGLEPTTLQTSGVMFKELQGRDTNALIVDTTGRVDENYYNYRKSSY